MVTGWMWGQRESDTEHSIQETEVKSKRELGFGGQNSVQDILYWKCLQDILVEMSRSSEHEFGNSAKSKSSKKKRSNTPVNC